MRFARFISALVGVACAGCSLKSGTVWKLGEPFHQPRSLPTEAVVVVYRPSIAADDYSAQTLQVAITGRTRILFSGSYVIVRVPAGALRAWITPSQVVAADLGASRTKAGSSYSAPSAGTAPVGPGVNGARVMSSQDQAQMIRSDATGNVSNFMLGAATSGPITPVALTDVYPFVSWPSWGQGMEGKGERTISIPISAPAGRVTYVEVEMDRLRVAATQVSADRAAEMVSETSLSPGGDR